MWTEHTEKWTTKPDTSSAAPYEPIIMGGAMPIEMVEQMKAIGGIPLSRLREICDAEREQRCVVLPCALGDTVYRVCACKDIPTQLDGTMYSYDGSPGTATGYYCPYENKCPHDTDDCKKVENTPAVFEDYVTTVTLYEDECWIHLANTASCNLSDFGKTVFLTRAEAEAAKQ